jgi:hypothetical protein
METIQTKQNLDQPSGEEGEDQVRAKKPMGKYVLQSCQKE